MGIMMIPIECNRCFRKTETPDDFKEIPPCVCGFWDWKEIKRASDDTGKSADFPHKCPQCASPAYIGFSSVQCSAGCRF